MIRKGKIRRTIVFCFFFAIFLFGEMRVFAGQIWTPAEVLGKAYANNAGLASFAARALAEKEEITTKYALSDPRVGWMQESNMTDEQRRMGPMKSWAFSQEIMFPTKYLVMGDMQKAKARVSAMELLDKKFEIRQRVLTLFYDYYSAIKILRLLESQRETLREIARVVESKRATGAVHQQDEMKAHVEQTKIENEILLQSQDIVAKRSLLNALLNRDAQSDLTLPAKDLLTPKIIIAGTELKERAQQSSKLVSVQREKVAEAEEKRKLAQISYWPDFMVSYQKSYGENASGNAYKLGLEMTIPLWFFAKQNKELSSARAMKLVAEKNLEQVSREVESEVENFHTKTLTLAQLLKIYETALIPQSTSALNSSRSAYGAGRVGFQELLDAERSLYSVQIEYYRHLARFVEVLTVLEKVIGDVVSDLPREGT